MDDAQFEALVDDALASLPEGFRVRIENVEFMVEMWPDKADLDDMGLAAAEGEHLLGLYVGVPLTDRSSSYIAPPDRILIYQGPILALTGDDPEAVRREVRDTVLHEVGHYFGMSEEDLEQLHEQLAKGPPSAGR